MTSTYPRFVGAMHQSRETRDCDERAGDAKKGRGGSGLGARHQRGDDLCKGISLHADLYPSDVEVGGAEHAVVAEAERRERAYVSDGEARRALHAQQHARRLEPLRLDQQPHARALPARRQLSRAEHTRARARDAAAQQRLDALSIGAAPQPVPGQRQRRPHVARAKETRLCARGGHDAETH
eukprot:6175761-Pleurochrysis_carterae.AAC.2